MKSALVVCFNGVEDVELMSTVDVLRRCGVAVTLASLHTLTIVTGQKVKLTADTLLVDTNDMYDAIVLPGGPGALKAFAEHTPAMAQLRTLIMDQHERQDIVAAICASPTYLARLGVLENAPVCVYPSCEADVMGVAKPPKEIVKNVGALTFGHIITSRGPGTALVFAVCVATALLGPRAVEPVKQGMLLTMKTQQE